ncbi:uncharacterized protein LOC101242445 [Ciona intestinalis]
MMRITYSVDVARAPIAFWIGLTDRESEGIYKWERCGDADYVDGRSYAPSWLPGEPDNGNKSNLITEEDCIVWHWSDKPAWSDENCNTRKSFICQINLKPATTTLSTTHAETTAVKDTMRIELKTAYIVAIGVCSAALLIAIVSVLTLCYMKQSQEKRRVGVLRHVGLYPAPAWS